MLIKIDVEGYERQVMRGASRTLADTRLLAVVMETNGSGTRYGVRNDELFAAMDQAGFSAYTYDPFERQLLRRTLGGNTIFIRDRAAAEARLRSAKRYRLVNGEI